MSESNDEDATAQTSVDVRITVVAYTGPTVAFLDATDSNPLRGHRGRAERR